MLAAGLGSLMPTESLVEPSSDSRIWICAVFGSAGWRGSVSRQVVEMSEESSKAFGLFCR